MLNIGIILLKFAVMYLAKKLRLMTFNIRNAQGDRNTRHDWINRKEKVLKVIQMYQPDIIGLQEVFLDQLEFLTVNLPEYQYVGVGRDDGKSEGEFNPIFYRGLDLEESGTFWLSDTPNYCSNTWGGLNRICTWIKFKGSIPVGYYNTHLEDSDQSIRLKSIPILFDQINLGSKERSIILVGDFNFHRFTKEYTLLQRFFRDTYDYGHKKQFNWCFTFHGFKGRKKSILSWRGRKLIDYIWVRGSISVLNIQLVYDNPGNIPNVFPSDHWPVLADVLIHGKENLD
jgi:endonuclease/exonuclease/phosphatase family metal-dependent hydrolase